MNQKVLGLIFICGFDHAEEQYKIKYMGYYYNSNCNTQTCSDNCCNYYGGCPSYYYYSSSSYYNQCYYYYNYYSGTQCSSSSSTCCYSSTQGYYTCSNSNSGSTNTDYNQSRVYQNARDALIGGLVGGVLGFIFLVVLIVKVVRKCRQDREVMPVNNIAGVGQSRTYIIPETVGTYPYGTYPYGTYPYGTYPPGAYPTPVGAQLTITEGPLETTIKK